MDIDNIKVKYKLYNTYIDLYPIRLKLFSQRYVPLPKVPSPTALASRWPRNVMGNLKDERYIEINNCYDMI